MADSARQDHDKGRQDGSDARQEEPSGVEAKPAPAAKKDEKRPAFGEAWKRIRVDEAKTRHRTLGVAAFKKYGSVTPR